MIWYIWNCKETTKYLNSLNFAFFTFFFFKNVTFGCYFWFSPSSVHSILIMAASFTIRFSVSTAKTFTSSHWCWNSQCLSDWRKSVVWLRSLNIRLWDWKKKKNFCLEAVLFCLHYPHPHCSPPPISDWENIYDPERFAMSELSKWNYNLLCLERIFTHGLFDVVIYYWNFCQQFGFLSVCADGFMHTWHIFSPTCDVKRSHELLPMGWGQSTLFCFVLLMADLNGIRACISLHEEQIMSSFRFKWVIYKAKNQNWIRNIKRMITCTC